MREVVAPVTPAFVSVPVSEKASAIARHGGVAPTRFERFSNDEYFTLDANRLIPALLSKVRIVGPVLEPAAGVGHLVRELRRGHGLEVIASDLRAYEEPLVPDIEVRDIWAIDSLKGFGFLITNLPYTDQDRLGAHLIALGARDGCSVALLTRAEWIVAGKRRALVHEHRFFAGVVFSDIATALVRGQHCLAATQFHLGRMVSGAAERDAAMGSIRRWGPCIPRRSRHSSASAGARRSA
jgi:hypothetical protein